MTEERISSEPTGITFYAIAAQGSNPLEGHALLHQPSSTRYLNSLTMKEIWRMVENAGAKAKNMTNNLPLLTVSGGRSYYCICFLLLFIFRSHFVPASACLFDVKNTPFGNSLSRICRMSLSDFLKVNKSIILALRDPFIGKYF
jgi:hypothetical protein